MSVMPSPPSALSELTDDTHITTAPPEEHSSIDVALVPVATDALSELDEILYVRNLRLDINRAILKDGKMSSNPRKIRLLMENLRDMDGSALTRHKIKADEEGAAGNQAATIAMVTETLKAMRGNRALPPEDITDVVDPQSAAPQLPDDLSARDFVPGEQQIGNIAEDIDTFKARMSQD